MKYHKHKLYRLYEQSRKLKRSLWTCICGREFEGKTKQEARLVVLGDK